MSKQTAVEWLQGEILKIIDMGNTFTKEFEQAKAMERQQIIDAYLIELLDKRWFLEDKECIKKAEQYYTQTFTEPKND
jgi:hypothetical protein